MKLFLLSGLWLIGGFYGFGSYSNSQPGTVSITIATQFSGQPLMLGNKLYHTANGDSLLLDAFRFYISGVELTGKGHARFVEKDSYHLVDAEESGTQTIVLQDVSAGLYDSLSFYVGTDSLTNVSGAMGGDLDPTLGMYWAWNSGYVNIKIEGRSKACKTLHHAFEFHIGGYMPPYQTLRRVVLPLNKFQVQENATALIEVEADLAKFFSHIQLATTNQVMIPSKLAGQLADYFKGVFQIR